MILNIKEKKERLLSALNLRIGDRIEFVDNDQCGHIFEINPWFSICALDSDQTLDISVLIDRDFKKVMEDTLLADTKCCDIRCWQCPLRNLVHNRDNCKDLTLLERLRSIRHNMSAEEYEFYAKRLTAQKTSDLNEERK